MTTFDEWMQRLRKTEHSTPIPAAATSFHMERDFNNLDAVTEVSFKCPNCGDTHTVRESYLRIPANFSVVSYALDCGFVSVAMPWAEKAARP